METVIDERYKALEEERNELIAKLVKLNDFLYLGKDDKLSGPARDLLREQKCVMENYVRILNQRMHCYLYDKVVK